MQRNALMEEIMAVNRTGPSRWADGILVILAVWLFISPWVLQFGSGVATQQPGTPAGAVGAVGTAAWNAWILGIISFFIAISAMTQARTWQEWATLVIGAWLIASPWVLGFANGPYGTAEWDHWCTGALIVLFSVIALSTGRGTPVAETSGGRMEARAPGRR